MIADLTVIIPTFNRLAYLKQSLESIHSQTMTAREVIIVNDGSTDGTARFLDGLPGNEIVIHQENTGKSTALNNCLQRASGKYVWIFDDDDIAYPDTIETHMAVLSSRPDIDFTYSGFRLVYDGSDGTITPGREVIPPDLNSNQLFLHLLDTSLFPQPAMIASRSAYNAIGGFNPDLIRSQDYDVAIRLARKFVGKQIPKVTYDFRQHSGVRGAKGKKFGLQDRVKKWSSYNQMIFSQLYETLSLDEYLSSDCKQAKESRLIALIHRINVMGRKGLWKYVISDLMILNEENRLSQNMDQKLADVLLGTLEPLPEFEELPSNDVQQEIVRQCEKTQGGRQILSAFSKTCYWHSKHSLRTLDFKTSVRYLTLSLRFMPLSSRARSFYRTF